MNDLNLDRKRTIARPTILDYRCIASDGRFDQLERNRRVAPIIVRTLFRQAARKMAQQQERRGLMSLSTELRQRILTATLDALFLEMDNFHDHVSRRYYTRAVRFLISVNWPLRYEMLHVLKERMKKLDVPVSFVFESMLDPFTGMDFRIAWAKAKEEQGILREIIVHLERDAETRRDSMIDKHPHAGLEHIYFSVDVFDEDFGGD